MRESTPKAGISIVNLSHYSGAECHFMCMFEGLATRCGCVSTNATSTSTSTTHAAIIGGTVLAAILIISVTVAVIAVAHLKNRCGNIIPTNKKE